MVDFFKSIFGLNNKDQTDLRRDPPVSIEHFYNVSRNQTSELSIKTRKIMLWTHIETNYLREKTTMVLRM